MKQGTRTDLKDEHSGITARLTDERNTKAQILRRLARERPDLLERYERGDITANCATCFSRSGRSRFKRRRV